MKIAKQLPLQEILAGHQPLQEILIEYVVAGGPPGLARLEHRLGIHGTGEVTYSMTGDQIGSEKERARQFKGTLNRERVREIVQALLDTDFTSLSSGTPIIPDALYSLLRVCLGAQEHLVAYHHEERLQKETGRPKPEGYRSLEAILQGIISSLEA